MCGPGVMGSDAECCTVLGLAVAETPGALFDLKQWLIQQQFCARPCASQYRSLLSGAQPGPQNEDS